MSVIDWDAKPEPWRTIGKDWAAQVRHMMSGYVMPPFPPRRPPTAGDRLRELRRAKRLTQQQLGEMSGYADTHISAIEAGRIKQPRLQCRRDIALALGVYVREIWR
jgi:DNA-binding XRE family transcriptional regulator